MTLLGGRYWVEHAAGERARELGAARIEFGQYKAWQVGFTTPISPGPTRRSSKPAAR